ncbi:MAG: hypothetical protein K5919_01845, partial [Clostridiales bacterium]|nr:hypothetical protein [Clostridiales bacterium]
DGESFRIAFGLVCIYGAAALLRMGNWTQNDTFRAAGDATFGSGFGDLRVLPPLPTRGSPERPVGASAALAVFRTLEGLVIGFFAGFSNAASVLVGTEVGAGRPDTAYNRAWRLVYLCQFFIALVCALLIVLHRPILTLMGMDGESFRIAFGLVCIYGAAALLRMGNWTQNDTFRAAGDATFGTVLEIVFMWALLIPAVWLGGMVWRWPTLAVFACCYLDEPIRYALMQRHLFRGAWIRPVTPEGRAAMRGWTPGKGVSHGPDGAGND